MKVAMIALAAAATLTAAAPAFAARANDRYNDEGQRQEQTYYNSGLSEHCQQVLNRPAMWGDKEVKFCQDSL